MIPLQHTVSRFEPVRSPYSPHPLPPPCSTWLCHWLLEAENLGSILLSFSFSLSLYKRILYYPHLDDFECADINNYEKIKWKQVCLGRHGNKASVLCKNYKVLVLRKYPLPTLSLPLCYIISPDQHLLPCTGQRFTFPLHPACPSAKHTLHFPY